MPAIRGAHAAIMQTQLSGTESAPPQKPAPLDDATISDLVQQLQTANPALTERLTAAIAKINRQNLSEEEKKTRITSEYVLAVKEFSASLTEIMQRSDITTSYKNKSQVLNACAESIRSDSSGENNQLLLDVVNKTNINLIGFNGLFSSYQLQVFGLSDDAPKLDDFVI